MIVNYNIALEKGAYWLAKTLDPFARGLHTHASICTFVRLKKKLGDARRVALDYRLVRLLRFFRA